MSQYGPPGEPGRRYPDDYGPPSDPWGTAPAADSWGYDNSSYADHSYQDPRDYQNPGDYRDPRDYRDYRDQAEYRGYPDQEDNWAPPPPPLEPARRSTGLYALVALLAVLAAGGVGYALYLLSTQDSDGGGNPAGGQTPTPAVTAEASASPAPSGSPRDNIGLNAATAEVDDCLINDGSSEQPQMRVVACDSDEDGQVFQVLAIFDERVEGDNANEQAQQICADTEGYRYHYYEVSDNASFVICMTEREA
jgi:hypothetical protein